MREPPFWWRKAGLTALLLAPAAALYGAVAARRMRRPGRSLPVPVICIGNVTVGGAGKTPTAIAVARLFQRAGLRAMFLSRGYGGRNPGPLRVDPAAAAAEVGDEPLLLARVAPTIIAHDRAAGADVAYAGGAEAVVMDDGLQNPALVKTVALVVLDGRRGAGNARVIPAGPLRAPLPVQLDRTHALLVIGPPGNLALPVVAAAEDRGLPVFTGCLRPSPDALARLHGQRLLAFAGIGHPDKFFAMLSTHDLAPVRAIGFPDHHPYTSDDATRLLSDAERETLTLVTTEKDVARMQGNPALAALAARCTTVPVELVLDDEAAMRRFLSERTGHAL